MKRGHVAAALLAGAVALGTSLMAQAQNPAPGLVIQEFKPAMDDLMTM
jgi:hypothetical protein